MALSKKDSYDMDIVGKGRGVKEVNGIGVNRIRREGRANGQGKGMVRVKRTPHSKGGGESKWDEIYTRRIKVLLGYM